MAPPLTNDERSLGGQHAAESLGVRGRKRRAKAGAAARWGDKRIRAAAKGLRPREFGAFAARIMEIDPALGEVVRLHAEAADGNSPNLIDWISMTGREAAELAKVGIADVAAAADWWHDRYAR